MSIWNKVLIGLISVASLAFFYLAVRTLKTRQHWQDLAQRLELKRGNEPAANDSVTQGLHDMTSGRIV